MITNTNYLKPIISICLPCYNVVCYLEKLFASLANQTFNDFELVFIDDGSTDDTYKEIKRLLEEYKGKLRGVVYTQKNSGVSKTRNELIKKANGEYLFFLDPDDTIPKDALQKLYNASNKGSINIVAGRAKFVFNDKWILPFLPHSRYNKDFNVYHYVKSNLCTIWGVLFKKTIFDNFTFLPDYIFEDIGLMTYIFLKNESFKFIKNVVYFYNRRIGKYSLSAFNHKNKWKVIDLNIQMFEIFSKYKKEGWLDSKEYLRIINGSLFQSIVANLWLSRKYSNNNFINMLPVHSLYKIYKQFNIKLHFSKTPWKILAYIHIKTTKNHIKMMKVVFGNKINVKKFQDDIRILNNSNLNNSSLHNSKKVYLVTEPINNLEKIIKSKNKITFLLDAGYENLYDNQNVVIGKTIENKKSLNNVADKNQFLNLSKICDFNKSDFKKILDIDSRILILMNEKYRNEESLNNILNIVFI
ncbi:MAG: glycosyltransferase family 2 protein [Mycoplasma sp.]